MRSLIIILSFFATSLQAQVMQLPGRTFDHIQTDFARATFMVPCPHQSWRLLPPYHMQIDIIIDTTRANELNLSGNIRGLRIGKEINISNAVMTDTEIVACDAKNIWEWTDCIAPYIVADLYHVYFNSGYEYRNAGSLGYMYQFHTATPFRPFTKLHLRDAKTANSTNVQNPYFGWYRKVRNDGSMVAVKQLSNIEWQVSFAIFMQ